MSVAFCTSCGREVTLRSRFEEECPECGEEALVEADAWDEAVASLRCANCGWEVDAVPPGVDVGEESGRYSVDDDCPICQEGDLVPADRAPTIRAVPEFALARAAARRVRERHRAEAAPIDVEAIARAEGVDIRRGAFGHDGMLVGDVIEVPDAPATTQRYVIAHELGHYELRHKVPEAKIEQEANAFAAELLMPAEMLRSVVRGGTSIRLLCRHFQVNRQPMIYALQRSRLLNHVQS